MDMMRAHLMLQGWVPAYWATTGYGLWHQEKETRYSSTHICRKVYCAVTERMMEPQYIDPPADWSDLLRSFVIAAFERSMEEA